MARDMKRERDGGKHVVALCGLFGVSGGANPAIVTHWAQNGGQTCLFNFTRVHLFA
jgi:hypothetical protein